MWLPVWLHPNYVHPVKPAGSLGELIEIARKASRKTLGIPMALDPGAPTPSHIERQFRETQQEQVGRIVSMPPCTGCGSCNPVKHNETLSPRSAISLEQMSSKDDEGKFVVAIELETGNQKVLCQSEGDLNKVVRFDNNFSNAKIFHSKSFVKEFMASVFPGTEYKILQAI